MRISEDYILSDALRRYHDDAREAAGRYGQGNPIGEVYRQAADAAARLHLRLVGRPLETRKPESMATRAGDVAASPALQPITREEGAQPW